MFENSFPEIFIHFDCETCLRKCGINMIFLRDRKRLQMDTNDKLNERFSFCFLMRHVVAK